MKKKEEKKEAKSDWMLKADVHLLLKLIWVVPNELGQLCILLCLCETRQNKES